MVTLSNFCELCAGLLPVRMRQPLDPKRKPRNQVPSRQEGGSDWVVLGQLLPRCSIPSLRELPRNDRMVYFTHSGIATASPTLAYQCRMFIIERSCEGTEEVPEEVIVMAGSTGNLHDVVIGLEPSCTCPDYMNGNHRKHIIYVCKKLTQRP